MPESSTYQPSSELIELVQRVLDKEASLEDIALLNNIIPTDPGARRYFVKMRMLHSSLMDHYGQTATNVISLKQAARKSTSSYSVKSTGADPEASARKRRNYLIAAAAMLLLSLAGTLTYQMLAPKDAFQVAACMGAENNKHFSSGTWLQTGQQYEVKSGLLELHSDDGNKLTIEGPAKFTIKDLHTLQLTSGKIWAELDGPSIDIRTKQGIVRDIGTTFGIDHSNTKVTRVDVFDGKVQVTDKGPDKKQTEAEAGVGLIAAEDIWPPEKTTADASLYVTGLRRPVGVAFVNDLLDRDAITSSIILDTQWTPINHQTGSVYPAGTNIEVRWAGSSLASEGGHESNLSKVYHTHLLGWPWTDQIIKKAKDLELPDNSNTGIVMQFRGMAEWLKETNAKGYRVEVLRNSGVENPTLLPVSLYAGDNTKDLVETLDSGMTESFSADYPDKGTSPGVRQHQIFSPVLTQDIFTLTVPGQGSSHKLRSNISAVRIIPVF